MDRTNEKLIDAQKTSTCEEDGFKMNERKNIQKCVVFIDESRIKIVPRMLEKTFHAFMITSIS